MLIITQAIQQLFIYFHFSNILKNFFTHNGLYNVIPSFEKPNERFQTF